MSSEIEITDGVQKSRDRDAATGNGNRTIKGAADEKSLKDRVHTASAFGDLRELQRLVVSEGCAVSQPDSDGYHALQWASLNNRVDVAQFIIQHGGDVNATDLSGQTALHWSAVRGAIQVAEFLLQEGAQIIAADMCGYQTTHVAAQYGQTSFLYHIVTKWNADPDLPDNNGRSPLHWAAYKGFTDFIRLLLFLDAYRGCQDKEGCTPLHWAAIRGNLEACEMLVEAGKKEDLMCNARKALDKRWDETSMIGRLSKLGLAPALISVIFLLILTYINSVILASNLPNMTAGFALIAWIGILLASAGLVLLCRCSFKDPGYVKTNRHDSQNMNDDVPLMKIEMNDHALLAGNWSKLCAICKIVRPDHSTHCSTCERCVEQYDHHCPLVSNCIGKRNNREFSSFLVLEVFAMLITGPVAVTRIVTDPSAPSSFGAWLYHAVIRHFGAIFFVISDGFFIMVVAKLLDWSRWFQLLRESSLWFHFVS